MIYFQAEDISFNLKNKNLLKRWIKAVVANKKRKTGDITFIFCTDAYLLNINQNYLKHDTYTDIITFDYSKDSKQLPVSGDIFISIERVKENATRYSTDVENELHRILIHGVLHLLGYLDKTKAAKAEMTKQEDECLKLFAKSYTTK